MPKRDEVYIAHPDGRRAAVPKAHFEKVLKPDGWVIDPNERNAADADPRTVRAAEKTLTTAAAKRGGAATDADAES